MDSSKLPFLLAVMVVGGFLLINGSIIVATIFLGFDHDFAIEVIEEVGKVMAGFIGLIIGFYFGRTRSNSGNGNGQAVATGSETPDTSSAGAS